MVTPTTTYNLQQQPRQKPVYINRPNCLSWDCDWAVSIPSQMTRLNCYMWQFVIPSLTVLCYQTLCFTLYSWRVYHIYGFIFNRIIYSTPGELLNLLLKWAWSTINTSVEWKSHKCGKISRCTINNSAECEILNILWWSHTTTNKHTTKTNNHYAAVMWSCGPPSATRPQHIILFFSSHYSIL